MFTQGKKPENPSIAGFHWSCRYQELLWFESQEKGAVCPPECSGDNDT